MTRRLTPADVAERYGCSPRGCVRIMRAAGGIDIGGGKWRVRVEYLDKWERMMTTELRPLPPDTVGDVCYFVADDTAVKIGCSVYFPKRLVALQKCNPRPLRVLALFAGGDATEAYFHGRFRELLIHSEWFRLEEPILALLRERAA